METYLGGKNITWDELQRKYNIDAVPRPETINLAGLLMTPEE